MLSPTLVKIINIFPDNTVRFVASKIVDRYIKKHANLKIEGKENLDMAKGPNIFICNHLSNSDGLILNKLLKDFDPTFVAGVKLSKDATTSLGTKLVKTTNIKPNSADKEALKNIVSILKSGGNIVIFPEGTRSRTHSMSEGKKGIILIARLSGASIVPIGMTGTEKLLPINDDGDMGSETWNDADVTVKIGKAFELSKKEKDEERKSYEERLMNEIMGSIAKLLPESYRGIYK